jgi:outer membrane protein insertion porin family
MKKTKTIFPGRFWKSSKFIPEKYKEDLDNIVNKYKSKGYRDARILWDSTQFNPKTNRMAIKLKIEESEDDNEED